MAACLGVGAKAVQLSGHLTADVRVGVVINGNECRLRRRDVASDGTGGDRCPKVDKCSIGARGEGPKRTRPSGRYAFFSTRGVSSRLAHSAIAAS